MTIQAKASCECGNTLNIEFEGFPYDRNADIYELSDQIGDEFQSNGWGRKGICPTCKEGGDE